MSNYRQTLGKWGEDQAVSFLINKGYKILKRNFRTDYGELDIICQHELEGNDQLVFVEVKTRTTTKFGFPEESVSWGKKQHILNSIADFMQKHPELDETWRVDVIAIRRLRGKENAPEIIHFENVFV
jgi:putative endonuclease